MSPNFILLVGRSAEWEKVSLSTHCPIMIRANLEAGGHINGKVCRCDTATIKKDLPPGRCPSKEHSCPARLYLISKKKEVTSVYELLPKKP